MANAFNSEEKQALANSVGMSGNVSPDVFNKELVNGEWQMYIKGGAGEKIFGPRPSTKSASVVDNAAVLADKAAGKTIEDVYSSMMVRPPSETDLRMKIGAERGYLDNIAGIREQAMDVRRKMLSPQSGIFNDPNATPEDKVNAYKTAMGGYMDRLSQLKTMEDEYSSELDTATKIAGERIKQENDRNKEILNWMKDERSQQNQDRQFDLQEKQMKQSASQFSQSNKLGWWNATKPEKTINPVTGEAEWNSPPVGDDFFSQVGDSGKPTFYGGRVKGDYGMDIAGKEGFSVPSPVNWTVLAGWSHKDYGSYVDIQMEDGGKMRLSHLDPEDIKKLQNGQKINAGDFISKQKNTGTIIAGKGRGVLDITTWGPDGKPRTGQETEQIIRSQSAPSGTGFDAQWTRTLLEDALSKGEIPKERSPFIYQLAKSRGMGVEEVRSLIEKEKSGKAKDEKSNLLNEIAAIEGIGIDQAAEQYLSKFPDEDRSKVIAKLGNVADGKLKRDAFAYAFKEGLKAFTNEKQEIGSKFDIADEIKDFKRSGATDLDAVKLLEDTGLLTLEEGTFGGIDDDVVDEVIGYLWKKDDETTKEYMKYLLKEYTRTKK